MQKQELEYLFSGNSFSLLVKNKKRQQKKENPELRYKYSGFFSHSFKIICNPKLLL